MTGLTTFLRQLGRGEEGTALIETALVAPILILLAIGTFEASAMVARQSELQSTAEQATEIALAVVPDTVEERNEIKAILMESSGLSHARIDLRPKYRCGSESTLRDTPPSCSEESLSTYISIEITDEYQPVWSKLGVSKSFDYEVNRTVQIS